MENIKDLVKQVNALLLKGEPGNVSLDEHTNYTGYKPQAIVDAMNEVFELGAWGFDELSSDIEPTEKGGLAVTKVKVWLRGVEFQPTGWGQNRVTRGDIGDARKGAQTDAIKKSLSYFSVGNRAYHGLLVALPKENNQQRGTQQPNRPATQRPTNTAPVSIPTKPAPSTKTDAAPENKKLAEIPTYSQLKQRAEAIGQDWNNLLFFAFADAIAKAKDQEALKQRLINAGSNLGPNHCQRIDAFLKEMEVNQKPAA